MSERHFVTLILLIAGATLIVSAWNAHMPDVWLLENLVVLLAAPLLYMAWRAGSLSRFSICLLLLFFCLHQIGTHYTYSHVPYDEWFDKLTGYPLGERLGWQRNHYDRAIHFAYGLLVTCPVREVLVHHTKLTGIWTLILPFALIMTTSASYELIEWAAALILGGDLGMEYLGIQGDIWDAHKDMALAAAGSAVSLLGCTFASALFDSNNGDR